MDTYSLMRQIADSWVLLAMFGFFAGAAIWAFLPSQSSARREAQMIPFRNEGPVSSLETDCTKNCASCSSAQAGLDPKGRSNG
ncbi:cbb3-type cytochrome c oxidase subunit 3 [Sulfitobacter sp.]|uniref:cbb3-type cytochrome c oxidase subunit 3 n=1 Tax=Sulfitobacter sp. TaxID=1903071 RepID=UPI0032995F45